MARELLRDPYWPLHAAQRLRQEPAGPAAVSQGVLNNSRQLSAISLHLDCHGCLVHLAPGRLDSALAPSVFRLKAEATTPGTWHPWHPYFPTPNPEPRSIRSLSACMGWHARGAIGGDVAGAECDQREQHDRDAHDDRVVAPRARTASFGSAPEADRRPAMPTTPPMSVIQPTCFRIMPRTRAPSAPSAIRRPISRVRCDTV